jgi:hypothetical protein
VRTQSETHGRRAERISQTRRENRRSLTDGQAERKRRGRQREPPVTRASSRRLWRRWRLRNSGLAVQNTCTVLPSRSRQRLHSHLRYQPLVLHRLFLRMGAARPEQYDRRRKESWLP